MSNHEQKAALRRAHYAANLEDERRKARERAQRQRKNETVDAREHRLERHREAQARYREKNRLLLKVRSWQYRKERARLRADEADEAECQNQSCGLNTVP
ncbi:hypothetical protein NLJ89_g8660 [Agrocybe chaxingu]|uniref:Uncharacterized protein n=1 Tax=Agrocybe chaxingu TaxID=84603 RepID=A0A9W8JS88_9AGAR|nr:hypothetical protein NLJ89_g8660 [Agrocybe chaxingu]